MPLLNISDKTPTIDCTEILRGWHTLQPVLQDIEDIPTLVALAKAEATNKNRTFLINRIKSRIAKIASKQTLEVVNEVIAKAQA